VRGEARLASRVAPAEAGSTSSLFMLGFAVAPLLYGPASDRYGRTPIVVVACLLFIVAAIGCGLARSLPMLLLWRLVQGAGAPIAFGSRAICRPPLSRRERPVT
jgi:DHA1 family bicyclomycin/chloramphenicol resistance-like MFS transporter